MNAEDVAYSWTSKATHSSADGLSRVNFVVMSMPGFGKIKSDLQVQQVPL